MSNQESYLDPQERSKEVNHSSSNHFMLGAVVGGIVGAATALFLTTKTGKELRHSLKDMKENAISMGSELVSVAMEKTPLSKSTNPLKEAMNKDLDFREKEEQFKEIAYVPIVPQKTSHEELQKKLQEAQRALEEEEQKIKI